MPEVNLELLYMIHHIQKSFDEKLHPAMELFHLQGKKSLLDIVTFFLHDLDLSVYLRVIFRYVLQILLFYPKKIQGLLVTDSELQELFGQLRLIVPGGHLQSEPLIVYLVESGILKQLFETVLYFIDIGLPLGEDPLAELKTDLLKVYVAQFSNQIQHRVELLERAVGEVGCMEPKTFNAFFCVLSYVFAYLFEDFGLRQIKTTEIDL